MARINWSRMTDDEIRNLHAIAKSRGDTEGARRAYGALYRRGLRAPGERAPGAPAGGEASPFPNTTRMLASIERAARLETRTGILQEQGVQPHGEGESITNAELAAVLEFGVPSTGGDEGGWRIPPRPAYGDAARDNGATWQGVMGQAVSEVLTQAYDGKAASFPPSLRTLGVVMRADVRGNIPYESVPNAPSTIARKGSSAPLIDTGDLANSIRSQGTDGTTTVTTG